MGKRSRKRSAPGERRVAVAPPPVAKPTPAPHARPVDRRARLAEAPQAPWHPFPLIELCILIGLICIVVGFVSHGDRRGTLLVFGFALVSLSSLELSIREHLAGYRSHTSLLSGVVALVVAIPLFMLTKIPQVAILGAAVLAFAFAFGVLRSTFQRRAGGLGFRA